MLAKEVGGLINDNKADVLSFDSLMERILGEKTGEAKLVNGCKEYVNLLSESDNLHTYDLIVVDEAQDFTEDWAFCVNLLLKDSSELYVFYDESQNVYSRSFGDKFFIDSEPFVLRYNIRNTANIYQYTKDRTALGLDTMINQIEGVEPDVRKLQKKQQVIAFLDSTVNKLVNKEGVAAHKITILSNRDLDQSVINDINMIGGYEISDDIDVKKNCIRFSTVDKFKGLESDIVIFINQTYKNEPQTQDVRSVQYTALTRARFYLYVVDYEIKE